MNYQQDHTLAYNYVGMTTVRNGVAKHPPVKFMKLPFYDTLDEIVLGTSLIPGEQLIRYPNEIMLKSELSFCLNDLDVHDIIQSSHEVNGVLESKVRIQMRFCIDDTLYEQKDCLPPGLQIYINDDRVDISQNVNESYGFRFERSWPLDITSYVKLSAGTENKVKIIRSYISVLDNYVVGVDLVKKLTSDDLMSRLLAKGASNPALTQRLIKENFNDDIEIATTTLRVSLVCPLGKIRINTPCVSIHCTHLQCFDALTFLKMNERKPSWSCPVCNKATKFDDLIIDGYFRNILSSDKLDGNEISLYQDGSWENLSVTTTEKKNSDSKAIVVTDDINYEDDDISIIYCSENRTALIDLGSSNDSIDYSLDENILNDSAPISVDSNPNIIFID